MYTHDTHVNCKYPPSLTAFLLHRSIDTEWNLNKNETYKKCHSVKV